MKSGEITASCLLALTTLGEASGEDMREWLLREKDISLSRTQITDCLAGLVRSDLPLIEKTGRHAYGKGRPSIWRLTKRGIARTVT